MTGNEPAWAERYGAVQRLADLDTLVLNPSVHPRWVSPSRFWYDRATRAGAEYRLVDAESGENTLIATHASVVAALGTALRRDLPPDAVILRSLDVDLDPLRLRFGYAGRSWHFDPATASLAQDAARPAPTWAVSPDGRRAISVRDHDLWVHDLVKGTEKRLTSDGAEDDAYGMGASRMRSVYDKYGLRAAPDGMWSPDSRLFFTLQTDEREVPELPATTYVPADGLRPTVHPNRTSMPGDAHVTEFRLFVLDPLTGAQFEPEHSRIPASRMSDTPFAAETVWWSADGGTAYFVDLERGERAAHVRAFDVAAGTTTTLFSETSEFALELSVSLYDPALIIPLAESGEVIWYSERTGRGHLYLYDLASGELVRALTQGDWQVRELLRVDPVRREVSFLAGGIDPAESPYVRKVCVAGLDDGRVRVVSGEPGDHRVWRPRSWDIAVLSRTTGADIGRISGFSPDGDYFVETVGDVDRLPRSVLRRRTGEEIAVLETAIGDGLPDDWRWPERVTVPAADGSFELHGLLFLPPDPDPTRSYPLVDLVYGSPQESLVPTAAFVDYPTACTFVEAAGYAALGAFCLVLDGRGTANRERAFRQASYGALQDVSNLDDHRATITALAARHPIDLDRVAITGFSGGGYLAALGALRHGDFFSVAVAASGNFDPRLFSHGFGERYQGPFDAAGYERAAAKTYAAGLRGHLMLIHGLEDFGVHPAQLFQFVQALIDENKDFDLVVLPSAGHEVTGYGMRRRLDYLVTHLFGSTPPQPVRMLDTRGIVMASEHADAELLASLHLAEGRIG
ncbi:DPP IV N-terminal domain-containing protein [Phytohabitans sp. ZYX-F-186]|uniref:DPP IV N-terminal domain-containing protein n=1 Tax=Phytohabitans maris TaxID=3071409 RepID=A0ABU0ZPR3_9ACTN|nr:DPP IV N-terminal domain-containing protein [Phytohabitans sp. ZYX-F-186]MDQ7909019.1 DPP IV N-terminal domain-containing protein [Phytohabitans sp. ZYX-F-186]